MKLFSEYFRKDHILSKIDARLKLLVAAAILIMVLGDGGFVFPLLITSLCLLLCGMMKIPLKIFMLRFSEPVFIALAILLLKFFFTGNNVLFSINIASMNIAGHSDGLQEGFIIVSRILGAVSIVSVMGFSTPFTDFVATLSWMRVPRGFVEILMFAYRFLFVLLEDAAVIYNAQKNRLGYSNIGRGMSSFGTLAGSLILKAFDRSHNITVAMIQRGYDGTLPMLKYKPFISSEIIISSLIVIALGAIWKL